MDSTLLWSVSSFLLGLLLGVGGIILTLWRERYRQQIAQGLLEQQLQQAQQLNERQSQQLSALQEVNRSQEGELREMSTRLQETRLAAQERQQLLVNSEQRLSQQFENLANRIFEQSGRKVEEQNRQSLDRLLSPLREQLTLFHQQVQEGFSQEARERHTLTHEIRNLQQLHGQMAQEALNLTNALKGNNKTLGNWGEVILSRVLEASGLREGHEYETQVHIRVDTQSRQQPDVVVHLPQEKDVVIDAKMSLLAYERYFNSDDQQEQQRWLKEHLNSIRTHIKSLSAKDYHQLPGLRTLDYILLFIPVEPAFMLAV
ncbi:MAG: DNA recombination protein RmuC, partial [Enterobacteriaceae bacterium]